MRYRVNSPQVINETIDGESIMIDLATGAYYSLDTVGGHIWSVLEGGASVHEVASVIRTRYDGTASDIEAGVTALINELVVEELVVEAGGTSALAVVASASATDEGERPLFVKPRLEKFTDMQDLILLDPVHEVDSRGWPHAPQPTSATG